MPTLGDSAFFCGARADGHGGSPPSAPVPSAGVPAVLEIACDESGSEGEKLIGGNTDVFAHAGVRMTVEAAADCMREIRDRAPSPATEYKANILLRAKHRAALAWLLGPSGPIRGRAHVHLIDKTFFAVGKIADLLAGDVTCTAGSGTCRTQEAGAMAVALYREGPAAFGRERWEAFLESFNDLIRAGGRPEARAAADAFAGIVGVLRGAGARGRAGEVVETLWARRSRAESFRERLLDGRGLVPALDPLVPSIVQTVVHWGGGGRPVSIVHDMQTTLTEERVTQLGRMLDTPCPALVHRPPGGRLAGLTLVDSRSDPRVQVADVLAGAARKLASDELNGRGDAELTGLLRPYVDPFSIWGDGRSWSRLRGVL
ncbi:hypothetical protein GCM10010156_05940 [Planobispora rosea]|uniref:DUF3800 domain-containing protein n=1 Tax=Planobispora rosea TaxID=35762 RepID=A0A8J3S5F6_PLARO|nr:DUF3800 domain-containing protein [Planobispora rosea]GGS50037.1 hypothetical protein GCM10010156_05940 [Planobispora rosea]GIH83878.1 hypothetical protein Pro02_22860 [Planobispora rosea]